MITTAELQAIFNFNNISQRNGYTKYYEITKQNYKKLEPIGHHLWMTPINYLCKLIESVDPLSPKINRNSILQYTVYVMGIPSIDVDKVDDSIKKVKEYCMKPLNEFITPEITTGLENMAAVVDFKTNDYQYMRRSILNILHYLIVVMRNIMASYIIKAAIDRPQPQVVPVNAHPVYKLYNETDISGGDLNRKLIGDGQDTYNPKGLISTNDVAGLLVKLKSLYMKSAYLQLIQTLSNLAERKSYQTITFRQDELKGVLEQIRKLSGDTYRQLQAEDRVISKMCYTIVKLIEPSMDEKKFIDAVTLDIGNYSSNNYFVMNNSYE